MKPKKNNLFCIDCGRPKMLFETEKKAQNFIKYNGNDILREGQTIDDIRVYYCPSCCGYHITTKPYKISYEYSNTYRIIKAYRRNNENKTFLRALKFIDDEVIKDILKQAQKASITSKKQLKQIIAQYFAQHTEYNKQQQDNIRHQINQLLKK